VLILDYVIIGNSAAGIGAVEGIRRVDREGKITIISDEEYSAYSRPLISYYLADKVTQEEMKYRPDEFYNQNNVDAKLGIKVTEVNEDDKKVLLEDDEEVTYDKLLVATGGAPFIPEMKGVNKENISNFIKLDDAKAIASDIKESEAEEVVILGAGLIGLKAAEALIKKGLKVTVVELADRVLSAILDKEAADLVQEHLEEAGINFILEDTIIEFLGDEKATGVKLKSGQELDCDLAVVAVGVKPNVSIVKGTNVEVNRGLVVNDKLETNIDDIYAAGDVSEGYDMLHEMAGVIPIWPNAYNQGLVAGQNMAGSNESYREGFARNAIGFFDLSMITAGIINPATDEYEVLIDKVEEDKVYKKIVLKDGKIVGFIYLNDVDRAGILTGLIKEQKGVEDIKNQLLADDFGYIDFDKEWRTQKLAE